jgi:hypothetical protein
MGEGAAPSEPVTESAEHAELIVESGVVAVLCTEVFDKELLSELP